MGTILKNIVVFDSLAIGVPISLPHRLNVNGIGYAPRLVAGDGGGFTISADATNVTVTRTVDGDVAVNIYVEYWHTIEGVMPLVPPPGKLIGLTPFIFAAGSGGGGPQIARGVFAGLDASTISSDGCSAVRNSNGNYTVTFSPAFPDNCAPVATIAQDVGGVIYTITVSAISGGSCDVLIYGNTDGFIPEDADFSIVAVATTTP